jgi:hypothetical protein
MANSRSSLRVVAAAAAASLFWSQAALAATPQTSPGIDPLVALSALGTAGSSSAVCRTAAQSDANGCVLAMNDAAQPAGTQAPPPEAIAAGSYRAAAVVPLLIALGAVIAVGAILIGGSSHGNGNLSPVSPA